MHRLKVFISGSILFVLYGISFTMKNIKQILLLMLGTCRAELPYGTHADVKSPAPALRAPQLARPASYGATHTVCDQTPSHQDKTIAMPVDWEITLSAAPRPSPFAGTEHPYFPELCSHESHLNHPLMGRMGRARLGSEPRTPT